MLMRNFRLRGVRMTPSLVLSIIALFAALSTTSYAQSVVPLAKRALNANKAKVAANALKLNNQTATQIAATPGPGTDAATLNGQTAAQIAATPGPTSSLAGSLFTVRSVPWSVQLQGEKADSRALCSVGEKAVAGGWDIANGLVAAKVDRPQTDGSGWFFQGFANSGDTLPASGSAWVVCAKVS
jgi:hypothetical protein